MDVKVFRTFLEVAKVRHFGHAASNLYITQAAVSARIKQLELFFDTPLFIRDRNRIKLTTSGEKLISYAEIMVSTLQQAKTDLGLASNKSIQLTLAATPNIWDAYLQHGLNVVTEAFDGYAFVAESQSREQLNRNLLERTLDMAFAFDPLKSEELACQKVAELELILVATSPSDVVQALSHHYVYVDWGTQFSFEHARRHQHNVPAYLRTSTGRIALEFILQNGGAAYLPTSIVSPYISSQRLYCVNDVAPWYRSIYLSYRKSGGALEAIKQVELMLNEL